MKHIIYFLAFALTITLATTSCSKKATEGDFDKIEIIEETTDTPKDAQPDVLGGKDLEKMSGEDLTNAYVSLVCNKYDECQVPGFKDRADCLTRVKNILLSNPQWKSMEFDKKNMELCLSGIQTISCGDFKGGKSPEACTKI